VLAVGVTETVAGLCSIPLANATMSGGKVAEKSMVWRFRGTAATMRRMGWMKPMSSMRFTLVEHQGLNAIQPHMSLLHEIKQATGRGHQDLGPGAGCHPLAASDRRAEHHHVAQGNGSGHRWQSFRRFARQFACGRQHQGAWAAQTLAPGAAGQAGQDGDGKGSGFAGAGLRAAEQIAAGQEKRNGLPWIGVGTL